MKKQTLYFILFLISYGALGQDTVEPELTTREDSISAVIGVNLAEYLPPLSLLIDVAVENSPDLDEVIAITKQKEYELGIARKQWTDFFSVGAQYRYGAVSGGQGATNSQALLFPEDLSVGAYAFLSLRVPLSYFVSRKDQIRYAEMNIEIMESRKVAQTRTVEQEVVETYTRLLLIQELIQVSSEAKESADLILEMSIERFRDGELTLDQLGANTGLKAKYSAEYVTLKTEFSVTYSHLERLLGVSISKLQKTQN